MHPAITSGRGNQCCEKRNKRRRNRATRNSIWRWKCLQNKDRRGWRPFVRRNWKRIAAAACAAAVAGAFLMPGKGAKPAGVDTAYLESAVEHRNITNVFSGSGTIAAANTYTVNALVSGTVLTADFAVGDTIEEGTVLYTIDSSNAANSVEKAQLSLDQAQRNYEDAVDAQYVRSTIGGTLASYKVAVGDVVTAGQEVATVRDASTLLLTLEFPAADAANFTVGQAGTGHAGRHL